MDPLDAIADYGTDALRYALLTSSAQGPGMFLVLKSLEWQSKVHTFIHICVYIYIYFYHIAHAHVNFLI